MLLRIFCAAFVVSSLFGGSGAKHFRSGYIAWTPVEGQERQVKFYFKLAYKIPFFEYKKSVNGTDCTKELAESGTSITTSMKFNVSRADGTIVNLFGRKAAWYTCQDIDKDWSIGFNETIITLPEQDSKVWTLWSLGCCWSGTLNNRGETAWLLKATIDLTRRIDNGLVNTSPRVDGLPIRNVLRGCNTTSITIATNDADGDRVKCRWTRESKGECGQRMRSGRKVQEVKCGNPDRSIFRFKPEQPCEITVNALGGEPGWYAVSLIAEDFLPSEYARDEEPLSSISYQFLVQIIDEEECVLPTVSPQSQCIVVPYSIYPYTMNIYAQTSRPSIPIVGISMSSKEGMSKSELIDDGDGRYHVVLSYTPRYDSAGKVETMCYTAVDEQGIESEQACLKFFVFEKAPKPIPAESKPNNLTDLVNNIANNTWQLHFTERIQLREKEPNNGTVTFLINGAVVHEVTLNEDNVVNVSTAEPYFVSFTTPGFELVADTNYTIRLAKGVVMGTGECPILSDPAEWQFGTGSFAGGHRLPDVSVECTTTDMTVYIERKSSNLPNFDPSILSFNDPECSGTEHNGSHIVVRTVYGKCGTEAIPNEDGSLVAMINNIYIPKAGSFVYPAVGEPVLIRGPTYRVRVNCTVCAKRLTYVEFTTDSSTIDIQVQASGNSNFSLRMYRDDTYRKPFYSFGDFPIATEDTLYFEARIFNHSSIFLPFLEECVATPSMATSDSLQYKLIENGCKRDESVKFYEAPDRRVRFSVEPFTFLGHNLPKSIFVYCRMRDCNKNKGECGDPTNCPEIAPTPF